VLFLLELVPPLLLGLLLARRRPQLASRLAPPLVRWGVPFSLMGLVLRGGLRWQMGEMLVLALAVVAGGLLLVHALPRQFPGPAERLGAVVGNTAYFGIPAALALLPPAALGYAISYDLAATLFTWTLGPSLIARRPLAWRSLLQALVASPASQGLVGAVLLQLTPWHTQLAGWLWWPARAVVWLSLVVLGLRMAAVLGSPLPRSLWPSLVTKLLLFPAAVLALALGLRLPPLLLAPLVLQAAAPTAVSVLLLSEAEASAAEAAGRAAGGAAGGVAAAGDAGLAQRPAALVLWSTLLALVSVPLWAWLLGLAGLSPTAAAS
jgi:predicted permease